MPDTDQDVPTLASAVAALRTSLVQAREIATRMARVIESSVELWSRQPMLAGPVLGSATQVRHLDEEWNETPEVTGLSSGDVLGPVLESGGSFSLVVASDDARLEGKMLVCSLQLVEGEALRFEAPFEQGEDQRWRAEVRATGLPAAEVDVRIPQERMTLYAVPSEPSAG